MGRAEKAGFGKRCELAMYIHEQFSHSLEDVMRVH